MRELVKMHRWSRLLEECFLTWGKKVYVKKQTQNNCETLISLGMSGNQNK